MNKILNASLAVALLLASAWGTVRAISPYAEAAAGNSSQEQLRKQIVNGLNQRLSTLQVTYSGTASTLKNTIKATLDAAVASDDYLHYIVKTYGYNASITGSKATITFKFTYWETAAQTANVKKKIAEALRGILKAGMNDHQKEKAIHDWIVTHLAYDRSLASHSAYDGLFKGKTVCQGYALVTYEMMKQAGIPVKIVEGTSRGIAHTWNLVQIGGKWYQLDTTWDDPVPDVAGRTSYDYYNLTDAQLKPDHKWKPQSAYPLAVTGYDSVLTTLPAKDAARKTFYEQMYEKLGFLYLTDDYSAANADELANKIATAAALRLKELTIRYERGVTVRSDMKKAFNAQEDLAGFSYSYEDFPRTPENDKLLRIKFKYDE
ncbi:transglutaminase domain-containing protein [Cohnella suwonensis]|uniref:Transglutaminase domain-containing protein n=1 Tax=Cohnella suwonensis TaxID=696072 RepID=A0ABW0LVA9_9BACL